MPEHRIDAIKWMQANLTEDAKICLAIRMPNGCTELIINQNALAKLEYILVAYDDELKLKTNPAIEIIDWMIYT